MHIMRLDSTATTSSTGATGLLDFRSLTIGAQAWLFILVSKAMGLRATRHLSDPEQVTILADHLKCTEFEVFERASDGLHCEPRLERDFGDFLNTQVVPSYVRAYLRKFF